MEHAMRETHDNATDQHDMAAPSAETKRGTTLVQNYTSAGGASMQEDAHEQSKPK